MIEPPAARYLTEMGDPETVAQLQALLDEERLKPSMILGVTLFAPLTFTRTVLLAGNEYAGALSAHAGEYN